MYRTVITPLILLVTIPVLAWLAFDRGGWVYVAALALVLVPLALLDATYRNVDHRSFRTGIMVVTVLAIAATVYTGIAHRDPLLAVPFLVAIAGVAGISRRPDAPRPAGSSTSARTD